MNNSETITPAEITEGLPDKFRPFLLVEACPLPRPFFPAIHAFWEATKIIQPTIRVMRHVNIVFAASPFTLNMPSGLLTYTTKPEVINACFNDLIFIDCNKMISYPFEIQIACVLEELVHIFYNVIDENLTTQIVGLLFPLIEVKDGKYHVRSGSQP